MPPQVEMTMKHRRCRLLMLDPPFFVSHFVTHYLCSRPREALLVATASLLIAFVVLNCGWFIFLSHRADLIRFARSNHSSSTTSSTFVNHTKPSSISAAECDLFRGNWVPDLTTPLYTNDTCKYMRPSQDCLQNGRLDKGYLYWKWKPHDCELLRFDSALFLKLMRAKKLVFIGDSIARNQMEALLCALAQVENPQNLRYDGKNKQFSWGFPSYNFTLTFLWAPFLVNVTIENDMYELQLDMPADAWSYQLADYHMAVISTGYWFFRPSIYYTNGTMLGVNSLSGLNFTKVGVLDAYKMALWSVLKYMVNEYRGITILRTVTVDHFEYGSWDDGGVCNRTKPFTESDVKPPFPWMQNEMNRIQVEEFEKAMAIDKEKSRRLKLLNVTYSAFLRPDGHPGSTYNPPQNDCLHWCLPGPIDMWNQLVLHYLLHLNSTTPSFHFNV